MKSISSVLKRRKKTRNIFLTKKQAYILYSIHRKGRGNNLCPSTRLLKNQQPHPQPLFPHPPQSRSSTTIIQQLSFPQPQPLLQPLFPQQYIRMMIQSIQLHEFPPKIPVPHPFPHPQPLLHPQPLSHPQFVAAKSLMKNSSIKNKYVHNSYYGRVLSVVTTAYVMFIKGFLPL